MLLNAHPYFQWGYQVLHHNLPSGLSVDFAQSLQLGWLGRHPLTKLDWQVPVLDYQVGCLEKLQQDWQGYYKQEKLEMQCYQDSVAQQHLHQTKQQQQQQQQQQQNLFTGQYKSTYRYQNVKPCRTVPRQEIMEVVLVTTRTLVRAKLW